MTKTHAPDDPTLLVNILGPKRGRPKSANPASELIKLRVTPDAKATIRKRAEQAGVTMTEYVLRLVLPDQAE